MTGLLLGIDCGHSATKTALYDSAGHEIASARALTTVSLPHPGWVERDPETVWTAVCQVVRDVIARSGTAPEQIAAVGVCGHSDGAYLIDASHQPVRPAILATDTRAHALSSRIADGPDSATVLALTGQLPFAGSTGVVLSWLLAHEPEAVDATQWVLGCKDWVRLRLTGALGTDRSEASASFTDVRTGRWSTEALDVFGLGLLADRLPPVHDSSEIVGTVTAAAATATGLLQGTPVIAGAHDVHAAAIGTGATAPHAASVVMGTFSINQVLADTPVLDPRWQARSFVHPGRWLHMASSPGGTVNLDWMLRQLKMDNPARPGSRPDAVRDALSGEPHMDTPLYLPFLNGPGHGRGAGASFVGIREWHDDAALVRAVAEGVAFNHRTQLDQLRSSFSGIGSIRLCGGGARNSAWTQLMADVLGARVDLSDTDEAGARGAALLAGVGSGIYVSLDNAVVEGTRLAASYEPRGERQHVLDARFARYQEVVTQLASAQ